MAKKQQEQQYIMSKLNTPLLNYQVYVMDAQEKLTTFLLGFLAGGAIGLVFYGNLFLDDDGNLTRMSMISNVVVFVIVGIIGWRVFTSMRTESLKKKRMTELTHQFRSFLESLAVSLSSGMNVFDSLAGAHADLQTEFSDNGYMTAEVKEMLAGIQNNIPIEEMLASLGERSGNDDIKNFATVFEICYRTGGNLKEVVQRTNGIISERIEIKEEIETLMTSNKTQFTAMMVIPVVIILLMRVMSSTFAQSFASPLGVVAMTIAIAIFYAAYVMGQKICNIEG